MARFCLLRRQALSESPGEIKPPLRTGNIRCGSEDKAITFLFVRAISPLCCSRVRGRTRPGCSRTATDTRLQGRRIRVRGQFTLASATYTRRLMERESIHRAVVLSLGPVCARGRSGGTPVSLGNLLFSGSHDTLICHSERGADPTLAATSWTLPTVGNVARQFLRNRSSTMAQPSIWRRHHLQGGIVRRVHERTAALRISLQQDPHASLLSQTPTPIPFCSRIETIDTTCHRGGHVNSDRCFRLCASVDRKVSPNRTVTPRHLGI